MSFLNLTGEITRNNDYHYIFESSDKKEKNITHMCYLNFPNPIMPNCFMLVFDYNPNITKSLLNSFLFPEDKRIVNVKYPAKNYKKMIFPEPLKYDSLDSIRIDILCECTLKDKYNEKKEGESYDEEDENIENKMLIDLEIQMGFDIINTKKIVDYAKKLDIKYKGKIIVISLVYTGFVNPEKKQITKIGTKIPEYKRIHKFDDYEIYQLDMDICSQIMSTENNLWILDEKQILNDESKEWLKYLTLPLWSKSYKRNYYALPPLQKNFFKNECVYDALVIIYNIPDISYERHLFDQKESENITIKIMEMKEENERRKNESENSKEILNETKSNVSKKKKKKTVGKKRKNKYSSNDSSFSDNSNN